MPHKVHIFVDRSHTSEHNAHLLENGILMSGQNWDTEVKELVHDQELSSTEEQEMLAADALLFPTTGSLSLFEKHFLRGQEAMDRTKLSGKQCGVFLSPHSTFDGQHDGSGKDVDNKLIDRLHSCGANDVPIILDKHHSADEDVERAGQWFAEKMLK